MALGKKKIEVYLDCVSPYSIFALSFLTQRRQALADLDVDVEFIPVFLGGIMGASGNKAPMMLPAKKAYGPYDIKRAQKYFGVRIKWPDFFPFVTLLPQRCLTLAKDSYPEQYEVLLHACFDAAWKQQKDLSQQEHMLAVLEAVFGADEAAKVLQASQSPDVKKKLNDTTKYATETLGAYGCPWFWVHNGKGKAEPFFGSDRFHYMWEFLELPHQDFELLSKRVAGKL